MANELKIRVIFDTGGTKPPTEQVKVLEGSLKDLELQYKKLQAIAEKSFVAGSPAQLAAMAQATQALNVYKTALGQVGTTMPGVAKGSANAAMTLQALNYTVRDSPYFFRDFSLGLLAIGNNLNPLIDGLIKMRIEAQAAKGATVGWFTTFLGAHTQGIILFMSILVSAIQAVTFAMAKNKSVAKEMGEGLDALLGDVDKTRENLRKYREELEKIGLLETPEKTDEIREAISKLIKEMNENVEKAEIYRQTWYNTMMLPVAGWIANVGMAIGRMFFDWDNKDNQKKLDLLTEGLHKLSQTSADVAGIFQSSVNGTLGDALKSLKFDDLTKLNTELGKLKGQLTADNKPGSINFGASWGWGTAEQIDKLQKKIHDILNPQKDKKDKTGKEFDDFAYLKPYLDELKKLEAQKPFAQTREEAEKLQEAIKKVNDEIDQFNNRIANEEKTSKDALKYKTKFEDNFYKEQHKIIEKGEKNAKEVIDLYDTEKIRLAGTTTEKILAEIENRYKKIFEKISELEKSNPELAAIYKGLFGQLKTAEIDKATSDTGSKKRLKLEQEAKRQGKSVDELNESLNKTDSLATQVGNSLFQAFTEGYFAADKFLTSLLAIAAQLVIVEELKYIFSGGVSGIFGTLGFAQGGIVGRATNGYVVGGQSYSGDKIPIMANSGEMVLNLSQQQNLLKLLSAPVNPYNQMMMGRMDAMNMNMVSGQPTILIQSSVPGLEFTKKTINPAQAKLLKGNIVNVS